MWVSNLQTLGLQTADPVYKLVSYNGSLSNILQNHCKVLSVEVISQQVYATNNLIREVYLLGDGVPWVHAITTVPARTYLRFKTELDTLGDNLLGKTLLYAKPYTRSVFEYARIDNNLARRSVFNLQNYELTVQETFLATIFTDEKNLA